MILFRAIFFNEPAKMYNPIGKSKGILKPFKKFEVGSSISGEDFGYNELYLADYNGIIKYMDHGDGFACVNLDLSSLHYEDNNCYSYLGTTIVSDIITYNDKRIIPIINDGLKLYPYLDSSVQRFLARACADDTYNSIFKSDNDYDTLKEIYKDFYMKKSQ